MPIILLSVFTVISMSPAETPDIPLPETLSPDPVVPLASPDELFITKLLFYKTVAGGFLP